MSIGKRIAKCRKEKNFSQEYIAELLEVSRQAVSKWETDQSEPDTGNLIKLAKVFNVSVEYLANGDEQKDKITIVEKKLPIFEIIGLIFFTLGCVSSLLGVFAPLLLYVGVFIIIFGIIFLCLKKDGAIICVFSFILSVILIIIQGLFWGIDFIVLCSIFGISILLPLLSYTIIKIIHKIRAKEFSKKIFSNRLLMKKIIIVGSVLVFTIITSITFVSINSKNKKEKWVKKRWFEENLLVDCLITDLPKPLEVDCINVNNEKMLLQLDINQYYRYTNEIYEYLRDKKFKNFGTQGDYITTVDHKHIYEFDDDNENYIDFMVDENDVKFIYSNSNVSIEGYFDFFVIYLNFVGYSTIVVDNEEYFYNFELTIEHNSSDLIYKYKTYEIVYDNYYKDLFVDKLISESLPNEEIYFSTIIMENEYDVFLNGEKIENYKNENGLLYYKFIMPSKKAIIEIKMIEEDKENDNILMNYYSWLTNIDNSNILSVEMRYSINLSNKEFNNHFLQSQYTNDLEIINSIIHDYQNIKLKKVDDDLNLDFTNSTIITFLLKEDENFQIIFFNDKYIEINNQYYEVNAVPMLLPYNSDQIFNKYLLKLVEEKHEIQYEDKIILETDKLSELFFEVLSSTKPYNISECMYKITTEIGELYIYNNKDFIFKRINENNLIYCELLDSNFKEIFGITFQ